VAYSGVQVKKLRLSYPFDILKKIQKSFYDNKLNITLMKIRSIWRQIEICVKNLLFVVR
jgi:hypothetical protein